jgi:integrase
MRKRRSANKSPHVGRDYLRPHEANAVIVAAGRVGRQRLRDEVMLRLMYRHGLRASEAKHTKWTDFDLASGSGPKTFHVRRLKGSIDSVHTLDRDEVYRHCGS